MNDATPTLSSGVEADYRLRELEARLERRIAAVESQHARGRLMTLAAGAGLVLSVAALALVGTTVLPDDRALEVGSLSTEAVVLRDADGVTRGELGMDGEGRSRLTLSDEDGQERIGLTVLADGSPGVTVNGPDGQPRAVLAYLPDGTTNLVLADAQGVSRAVFGIEPDGSARALFSDRTGAVRTLVGVDPSGVPNVSVVEDTP